MEAAYVIYMLRCRDGSLYTGIARNLDRRIAAHRAGRGSRYVASRLPVDVVWSEVAAGRSEAQKREAAIKGLSRADKERLVTTGTPVGLL